MCPLADRFECRDDGLSGIRLELAVLRVLRGEKGRLLSCTSRKYVEEVRHPGLRLAVVAHLVVTVGNGSTKFLDDGVRFFEEIDDPCITFCRLGHLVLGALEIHYPRAYLWSDCARDDERVTESPIETNGDVSCDLDMLPLIVAHGHLLGVVEQDVGGLKRRVGEQSGGDEFGFATGGLVLELGHSAEFAVADETLHHPSQLVVFRHMGLHEDRGDVRVESDGKEDRRQVQRAFTEYVGLVGDGKGMEVDDAVVHVRFVLARHPIA